MGYDDHGDHVLWKKGVAVLTPFCRPFRLDCASDDQIWEHARVNEFAIVTKDEDYDNLSVVALSTAVASRSWDKFSNLSNPCYCLEWHCSAGPAEVS
ncbi:MAG: DUF5615 family PIN-like protein, partial [Planctomycetes bacterium]|nr:DUF5615 family PIN-like protein [Planctomycetota bacterium]